MTCLFLPFAYSISYKTFLCIPLSLEYESTSFILTTFPFSLISAFNEDPRVEYLSPFMPLILEKAPSTALEPFLRGDKILEAASSELSYPCKDEAKTSVLDIRTMNKNIKNFIVKLLLFKWILLIYIPESLAQLKINQINTLYKQEAIERLNSTVLKIDEMIFNIIKLPDRERKRFATLITLSCKKYNLNPKIMISIIKVESDFKQKAVSNTGDFSIAQINYKIWVKRFRQLDRSPLDFERLKEDDAYAIFRMGEILAELKKHHEKTDQHWFARYHSNTPVFKNRYIKNLEKNLKKIEHYKDDMLAQLPDYEIIASLK